MVRSIVGTMVDVGLGPSPRRRCGGDHASARPIQGRQHRAAARTVPLGGEVLRVAEIRNAASPSARPAARHLPVTSSARSIVGRPCAPWRRHDALEADEKDRPACPRTPRSQRHPARLARRRRRRPGARPRRHRGGPHPAGQAQADLRPARRHRRPRDHRQRRQDRAHLGQGREEDRLPPLGLPRRLKRPDLRRAARSQARGGGPPQRSAGMLPKNRLGRQMLSRSSRSTPARPTRTPPSSRSRSPSSTPDAGRESGAVPSPDDRQDRSLQTTGRRKQAVARVRLRPGSGKITINGRDARPTTSRPTTHR